MTSLLTILFLHGWHSTPQGVKSNFLQEQGHKVVAPTLSADSFEAALESARKAFEECCPDVVVGSSRGGACAMNIDTGETPLVLVCPAWKHWGEARTVKANTIVLHSPNDEVVPYQDSVELVAGSHLGESALVPVGMEHRMGCESSLRALAEACLLSVGSLFPKVLECERLVATDATFPSLEHGTRHRVSRVQKPQEYPDRGDVPEVPGEDYRPMDYTSPKVLAGPDWAEDGDFPTALKARAAEAGLSQEPFDDRTVALLFPSYETPVVVDGVPRNPRGVTGITGRGLLGKYGENTAADPIVFRRYLDSKAGVVKLQMIAIQRRDNGMWAIPGGMTDFGESVSETLGRELREEALGDSVTPLQAREFDENFRDLFEEKGVLVYQGAVDDFRNTDTSWMATKVQMLELDEQDAERLGWDMSLSAGDDAQEAGWMDVTTENLQGMNANHGDFVGKAVQFWQVKSGLVVRRDGVIGKAV